MDGQVTGVLIDGTRQDFDAVISTIPMALVSRMVPALPDASKALYDGIKNIGVACLVFKLKSSVTPHFWVNISDRRVGFPELSSFPISGRPGTRSFLFPITCQSAIPSGRIATSSFSPRHFRISNY